jgi:anthranilate synthase component 1
MTLQHLKLAADGFDLSRLHQRHPQRYPFLLESVAAHPQSGRWDILFAEPGENLVGRRGQLLADGIELQSNDFFAELDRWAARQAAAPLDASLPYVGGWFFLLGYEAARWVEPQLRLPDSPHALPDALAVRCRGAVIHDREQNQLHLVSESGVAGLAQLRADTEEVRTDTAEDPQDWRASDISEQAPRQFTDGVSRILEWLGAGDVFQINLSRPWDAVIPDHVCPATLYRRLRLTNPAPFAGIARWGDSAVISS